MPAANVESNAALFPLELTSRIIHLSITDPKHIIPLAGFSPDQLLLLRKFSLVCLWWAANCRTKLFENITLRSMDDFDSFRALDAATPGELVPARQYVKRLFLEQTLGAPAWFYKMYTLVKGFYGSDKKFDTTNCPHTLIMPKISLILSGPPNVLNANRIRRCPIFWHVPKILPIYFRRCGMLSVKKIHCSSLEDACNLTREMFVTDTLYLKSITWDTTETRMHPPPFGDLLLPNYDVGVTVTDCTDVVALTWAAFRTAARTHCDISHSGCNIAPFTVAAVDVQSAMDVSRAMWDGIKSLESCPMPLLQIDGPTKVMIEEIPLSSDATDR